MKRRSILIAAAFFTLMTAGASASMNLTLQDALRMSEEHSYAIKSSLHDSLTAARDLGAAKSLRFPNLSLVASSYYISELQSIDIPFNKIEIGAHKNYQADLNLNMPLYSGGKISGKIKVQHEVLTANGYSLEAVRARNCYLTRKAYLNLMLSDAIVRSAEASVARTRIIDLDIANLYESGLADSTDLLEAELALQKGMHSLEEKKAADASASVSLKRLLGVDPGEEMVLSEALPDPDFAVYRGREYEADMVQRAELKALESKSRAAEMMVGIYRADLFPDLGAYIQYSYGKPNKDIFNKTWNDYWTAGLSLKWDFNLGGGNIKNISSAKERAKSLHMAARETDESFAVQADIAFQNLKFANSTYVISTKEFEIAKRQFQLAGGKNTAGTLSLNRLLEIESDLANAEQMYRASIINYYIAETEYLYAIGSSRLYGGF